MEEFFKNIDLKEIYDSQEWTKDHYRFFKNRVSYERNPIIKINLKKNEYIIKNVAVLSHKNETIDISNLCNKNSMIKKCDDDNFLILQIDAAFADYKVIKLELPEEDLNKLKLLITV